MAPLRRRNSERQLSADLCLSLSRNADAVRLLGELFERQVAANDATRASLLHAINDVGRFDISGSIVTVGRGMIDAPPKVFLTVIQKDGTFRPLDRL